MTLNGSSIQQAQLGWNAYERRIGRKQRDPNWTRSRWHNLIVQTDLFAAFRSLECSVTVIPTPMIPPSWILILITCHDSKCWILPHNLKMFVLWLLHALLCDQESDRAIAAALHPTHDEIKTMLCFLVNRIFIRPHSFAQIIGPASDDQWEETYSCWISHLSRTTKTNAHIATTS